MILQSIEILKMGSIGPCGYNNENGTQEVAIDKSNKILHKGKGSNYTNHQLERLDLETNKSQYLQEAGSELLRKNQDERRISMWMTSLSDTYFVSNNPLRQEPSTDEISLHDKSLRFESKKMVDPKELKELQIQFPYVTTQYDVALVNMYVMDKKGLVNLLKAGPPKQRLRWSCWQLFAHIPYRKFSHNEITKIHCNTLDECAIRKDTVRSYNIPYFQNDKGNEDLEYVLSNLTKQFKGLGYCQGMNFIGGFVLNVALAKKHQSQDDHRRSVFHFLRQMFVNHRFMLCFLYCREMPLVCLVESIFENELERNFPEVKKHLKMIGVQNAFWITKIVTTLFLYSFHMKYCQRIWDIILTRNIFQMVSIVLSLVSLNLKVILKQSDEVEFIDWFKKYSIHNPETEKEIEDILAQVSKYTITVESIKSQASILYETRQPSMELFAQDFGNTQALKQFIQEQYHL